MVGWVGLDTIVYNVFIKRKEEFDMAVTEAQARASAKWQSKAYDRVSLRIRKDADVTRDMILQAAESVGESLNEYILNAVYKRMREGS